MKIQVTLDPTCKEPEVTIRTSEMTEEVGEIAQRLSVSNQRMLAGFTEDSVELLDISGIIRIYTVNKSVVAETSTGTYTVKMRLYELEERLDKTLFVRISHSEIVNLKAVVNIDLSFTGTIAMTLTNNATAYVSRRYVSKIKQALGM
ncbi:MAG: LytTR family transcriptional regulator DNA-binding domain-containing protein [Oscillospiraceae bacterium]|nr:LytTR family transcriptional regulator DNA-binding domain-containing protein [Oscillospiraceae bacterium]